MAFYRLTRPEYETDLQADAANPIYPIRDMWLPGLSCDACGTTWAGSRRLYLPISTASLRPLLQSGPLPRPEWETLSSALRVATDVPEDFQFMPGDVLGDPIAELHATSIPDFLHPFPGQIIVGARVAEVLTSSQLEGFRCLRVRVRQPEHTSLFPSELPELYELLVSGKAQHADSNSTTIGCKVCGRPVHRSPWPLLVDRSRWDGSDMFHVDNNPNIVVVTRQVCSLLADINFSNYACLEVSHTGA